MMSDDCPVSYAEETVLEVLESLSGLNIENSYVCFAVCHLCTGKVSGSQ